MNMVIGAFFSEVGNEYLRMLAGWDENVDERRERLRAVATWERQDFEAARSRLAREPRGIGSEGMNLQEAHSFLGEKRVFLLRLLENPKLLEHEAFTALLRAVLHVAEEPGYRTISRRFRKPIERTSPVISDARTCFFFSNGCSKWHSSERPILTYIHWPLAPTRSTRPLQRLSSRESASQIPSVRLIQGQLKRMLIAALPALRSSNLRGYVVVWFVPHA